MARSTTRPWRWTARNKTSLVGRRAGRYRSALRWLTSWLFPCMALENATSAAVVAPTPAPSVDPKCAISARGMRPASEANRSPQSVPPPQLHPALEPAEIHPRLPLNQQPRLRPQRPQSIAGNFSFRAERFAVLVMPIAMILPPKPAVAQTVERFAAIDASIVARRHSYSARPAAPAPSSSGTTTTVAAAVCNARPISTAPSTPASANRYPVTAFAVQQRSQRARATFSAIRTVVSATNTGARITARPLNIQMFRSGAMRIRLQHAAADGTRRKVESG